MKNDEVLAYIKVTRVFTLSEITIEIAVFLSKARTFKIRK